MLSDHKSHLNGVNLLRVVITAGLLLQLLRAPTLFATEYVAGGFHQQGPYSYSDASGQRQGVLVDSLNVLMRDGDSITYRVVPHGRLIYELMQGSVDVSLLIIAPTMFDSPSADSLVISKYPLFETPIHLYSDSKYDRNRNFPNSYSTITELNQYKIGIYRPSSTDAFFGLKGNTNIVYFTQYESAAKSLVAGRIDLLAIDPLFVDYWEKKLSASWVKQFSFSSAPVHIAFSKKSLGENALVLCNNYWRALKKLAQENQLETLFHQYQNTPFMDYLSGFEQQDTQYCRVL
ncbi:MAG: substrate-binding periplasmic protein [Cellvibrionaceae bacterium]